MTPDVGFAYFDSQVFESCALHRVVVIFDIILFSRGDDLLGYVLSTESSIVIECLVNKEETSAFMIFLG